MESYLFLLTTLTVNTMIAHPVPSFPLLPSLLLFLAPPILLFGVFQVKETFALLSRRRESVDDDLLSNDVAWRRLFPGLSLNPLALSFDQGEALPGALQPLVHP